MRRVLAWLGTISLMAACGGPDDDPIVLERGVPTPSIEAPPAADDPAPPAEVPDAPAPPEATPPPAAAEPPDERTNGTVTRHLPTPGVEAVVHPAPTEAVRLRRRPLTQAPVLGGGLWVDPAGGLAIITDPAHDRVYFVDPRDMSLLAHHVLQKAAPWRILVHDDVAWITLRRSGEIARFDLSTHALIDRVPVCGAPRGLAYDPRAEAVHVACAGGDFVSLDPTDAEEIDRVWLEPDLRDVVVTGEHVIVSKFREALLLVVRNGRVIDVWQPRPRIAGEIRAASPTVAWRTVRGPHDSVFMMHQRSSEDVVHVRGRTGYSGGRGVPGGCPASLVQAVATQFTTDGYVRANALIAESGLPVDVAVRENGDLMVADGVLANETRMQRTILGVFQTTVNGVEGCPQSGHGFVTPLQAAGVVAVAFDAHGMRYGVAPNPLRLVRLDDDRNLAELRLPGQNEDPGRVAFHTLTPAQIACASCHPEASDDGHVWHFAELGDRRSQHLRGGLAGTEPFHWDGEFANMAGLVQDVMGARMGLAHALPDGDQLLAWLDGLPSSRVAPTGGDDDAVARGAALYADAQVGCTGCHALDGAPITTESVNVGTGGLFQVPTLKGIAGRPPFLHDGCAPTLTDRFSRCGGGDAHGQTSHLGDDQIADLVAFLRTL